jgi:hypothetical protein
VVAVKIISVVKNMTAVSLKVSAFTTEILTLTVDNGAIIFSIAIAQSDGLKNYAINF